MKRGILDFIKKKYIPFQSKRIAESLTDEERFQIANDHRVLSATLEVMLSEMVDYYEQLYSPINKFHEGISKNIHDWYSESSLAVTSGNFNEYRELLSKPPPDIESMLKMSSELKNLTNNFSPDADDDEALSNYFKLLEKINLKTESKIESNKANSADTKSRAAD